MSAIVRFVASRPASTAGVNGTVPPATAGSTGAATLTWTVSVTIVPGPPERARMVDGSVAANYQRVIPPSTTALSAGAANPDTTQGGS